MLHSFCRWIIQVLSAALEAADMKRWLGYLSLFAVLLVSTPSFAANTSVPNMTAATAVAGTDLWYCVQSAGTTDRKCTSAQVAAYIYGLMSGDATTSGTGAITF